MSRIEDLEKRLSADPNSKIFVQLAEEYRKAGLPEDAIATCREGLDKHPNYFSARVALGRALLETDALDEARAEFDMVLQQVPDNLLALKFLGEALHRLGRVDEALSKYQLASTLSPEDADLADRIQKLESEAAAAHAGVSPAADPSVPPGEQSTPPTIPPANPAAQFIEQQAREMSSQHVSDDILSMQEEFEDRPVTSIFHRQAREIQDLGSIPPPSKSASPPAAPAEPAEPAKPPEPAKEGESGTQAPRETAMVDLGGAELKRPLSPSPKAPPSPPEEVSPPVGGGEPVLPVDPQPPAGTLQPAGETQSGGDALGGAEETPGLATTTLAEMYVSQGHLERGVNVYRQLVASNPNKPELQSRLEELELLVTASQEPNRATVSASGFSGPDRRSMDPNVRFLEEAIRELEGWLAAIGRS